MFVTVEECRMGGIRIHENIDGDRKMIAPSLKDFLDRLERVCNFRDSLEVEGKYAESQCEYKEAEYFRERHEEVVEVISAWENRIKD